MQYYYLDELVKLLKKIDSKNIHTCLAKIPCALFDMRSGTLPEGVSGRELLKGIEKEIDIEKTVYRKSRYKYKKEYSIFKIIKTIHSMAYDRKTVLTLYKMFIMSVKHKLSGRSDIENTARSENKVRLVLMNKIVELVCPTDMVTFGLLWEIFGIHTYDISWPVSTIYDFGANIGLSTSYFFCKYPDCQYVCIEPMQHNLEFLERNIKTNAITAKTIKGAVGSEVKEEKIFFSEQSHALPSLYHQQKKFEMIESITLDRVVQRGSNYGMKVDIEGAEENFVDYPEVVKRSTFVVGELHYSFDEEKNIRISKFYDLIKKHFSVEEGEPSLYFVENDAELCIPFRAIRKEMQ